MNNKRRELLHHVIFWIIINESRGKYVIYGTPFLDIFTLSQILFCYDNDKTHSVNTNLCDCDGFCCWGTVWNTESCSDNLRNFSQSSCLHSL